MDRSGVSIRVLKGREAHEDLGPGLGAKPIIDIDVVVDGDDLLAAMAALETLGYEHQGDLGVTDREALQAPDEDPRRHVYVCRRLPSAPFCGRDPDLREEYGAVKTALAADSDMDIETYVARKSAVLQNSSLSAT